MSARIDDSDLRKRLTAMARKGPRNVLETWQLLGVRNAKENTRPFRKTGNLGRTTHPGPISDRQAEIDASADYAGFVERGTGLYGPRHRAIVPVNAKVLAWRTGAVTLAGRSRVSGGKELAGWAFARSVKGRKATPFLLPGAQKALADQGLKAALVKPWNDQ